MIESGVWRAISFIPIIIKILEGLVATILCNLANTPKVLSPDMPLFFTFLLFQISAHSPISVILLPKKTISPRVLGSKL